MALWEISSARFYLLSFFFSASSKNVNLALTQCRICSWAWYSMSYGIQLSQKRCSGEIQTSFTPPSTWICSEQDSATQTEILSVTMRMILARLVSPFNVIQTPLSMITNYLQMLILINTEMFPWKEKILCRTSSHKILPCTLMKIP